MGSSLFGTGLSDIKPRHRGEVTKLFLNAQQLLSNLCQVSESALMDANSFTFFPASTRTVRFENVFGIVSYKTLRKQKQELKQLNN